MLNASLDYLRNRKYFLSVNCNSLERVLHIRIDALSVRICVSPPAAVQVGPLPVLRVRARLVAGGGGRVVQEGAGIEQAGARRLGAEHKGVWKRE